MPIVKVTVGDIQSAGLLHPVLYVGQPEDQVEGGEEEHDEEAEQRGEQEDRGWEAGEETPSVGTAGTAAAAAGRHFIQSPV